MKNLYTIAMIALLPVAGHAQIGVGTTSLDATAMLQVNASASTNAKGFLGPRVALTSTSANSPFSVTPATGLMVYNTATAGSGVNEVKPGYYTYTGTGWERLAAPPTTFVGGNASIFPIDWVNYEGYSTTYIRPSLGNIVLPPGRWEITAEFTCIPDDNNYLGDLLILSRQNTYWISEAETYSGFTNFSYPLNLSGLAVGSPTSHAIFSGAAVAVRNVSTTQSLKFYINNPTSADKTYYLYFHESLAVGGAPDNPGGGFRYKSTSLENRLYAVKIQ